jgi:hypothetical protein
MKFKKEYVYTIRVGKLFYHTGVWIHYQVSPKYLSYRAASCAMKNVKRTSDDLPIIITEYKQELTEVQTYETSVRLGD